MKNRIHLFKLLSQAIYFSLIFICAYPKISCAIEQFSPTSDNLIPSPNLVDQNQYREKLSLVDCFRMADSNNKEIALAASNLSIAQAGIVIAKAIPNPTFNLAYGFGPAWKYIIAGNNQQFGWNEEIQIAGKRTKKINLACASKLQTAFEVEAVRFDVHNRVRRTYAELVMATAFARLTESQGNIMQKLLDIAQKRFQAGKAPESEVLQAKLNVMQIETQRNQSKARLVVDSIAMAFLLGETPCDERIIQVEEIPLINLLTGKSDLVPDPNLGLPSVNQLLPTAWQERNDLKAAVQQAYANRKALTLAKSQRIPNPFLGFNYLFSTYAPYQLNYFTPVPGTQRVPYQPGYMLTTAVETPIFYQHQGEVSQAKATWLQQKGK